MQRVVVARSAMREVVLPPGVQITHRKRRGRRVIARGAPHGEAPSVISAFWPDDQQIEVRTPQMLCVVEGHTDLHLSDYTLHCPQGHFVFIPPGVAKPAGTSEPHLEGRNRLHGACDILWFALHRRWMQMWMCHSQGTEHFNSRFHENLITTDSYPSYLLEAFWEGMTTYQRKYDELYNSLLQSLMLCLLRDVQEERFLYVSADTPNESYADSPTEHDYSPIEQAREYVLNHLHENLTLERVAQKVYMSRAQFARRFHEDTGQTFTTFVTQCRLEQAQHLLRETGFTLAYISRLVGYKSAPHLNNLFARHLHTTPLQYRRQSRQPAPPP